MHLLYLDDSGSSRNISEDYLVLGGVSVYEAQCNWLTQELDKLAAGFNPTDPHGVEFHASAMFSAREEPWRSLAAQAGSREKAKVAKVQAILSVLDVFGEGAYDSARAFACVVHKASYPGRDPMEVAFEDLCSRFSLYLARLRAQGDKQRGFMVLDRSADERNLQRMAVDFRTLGTRWGGVITALADTPVFVDSRASRMIQLADHVAYATFRRYEKNDAQYFDRIAHKFDSEGGIVHGLVHKEPRLYRTCMCPACVSRRVGKSEGAAGS